MEHCKLQIGCLIILLVLAFSYIRECMKYHRKLGGTMFITLLAVCVSSNILDALTAYTVNHLDTVDPTLNKILHMLFLISIDAVIFVLFLYMLDATGAYKKNRLSRLLYFVPFVANIFMVIAHMGMLEYIEGNITNYSMGISAYACFIMGSVYIVLTIIVFIKRWNYIERHKRASIFTYLFTVAAVAGFQMIFPESLITSIASVIITLGVYLNQENPALVELSKYHNEMVMGFATMVENRDDNTGGHIKRTSQYVKLIAEELRDRGYYNDTLTKDYIENLLMAAPMHDIGKITVPDSILQKPGKLTAEEFEVMKTHTKDGGRIIHQAFKNLGNDEYLGMAYHVATYHHEKWNGGGYPEGLSGKDIPLCARIMSVADVFDALSEKRCYRDALPLNECFEIIKNGSGTDFEPLIADIFLDIRERVERIHDGLASENAENLSTNTAEYCDK